MKRFSPILILCLIIALITGCAQQDQQLQGYTPTYQFHKGRTASIRNGKAVAPDNAPPRIKRAIAAANRIAGKPYRRGGGHGRHVDSGYDCSGSTAYVLREAGMLQAGKYPTSSCFLKWGHPGFGKWLTVYTKRGHVFLMIAGLRFDTTGSGRGIGPRWYTASRPCSGFKVRHIPGF